jgi:hypothetical protein
MGSPRRAPPGNTRQRAGVIHTAREHERELLSFFAWLAATSRPRLKKIRAKANHTISMRRSVGPRNVRSRAEKSRAPPPSVANKEAAGKLFTFQPIMITNASERCLRIPDVLRRGGGLHRRDV